MKKNAVFTIPVLALVFAAGACQTLNSDYRQGVKAEMNQDYEEAVRKYQAASLQDPKESDYRMALTRASVSASLYYLNNARTLVAQNKKKEAEVSYRKALVFYPKNAQASTELRALLARPWKTFQ